MEQGCKIVEEKRQIMKQLINAVRKGIKDSMPEDINFDIMIVKNSKVLVIIRY